VIHCPGSALDSLDRIRQRSAQSLSGSLDGGLKTLTSEARNRLVFSNFDRRASISCAVGGKTLSFVVFAIVVAAIAVDAIEIGPL